MKKIEEQPAVEVSNKSYHVVLKNYDGPLDLLLDLVHKKKIRIEEIFISDITEQYLAAMDQLDELDMDQAADFIEVAATLLEIKSRALLPRPEVVEAPEDDPATQLINRIEEYKLYKEAAEKMREQELVNMHFREPDGSVGVPRLVLKDMTTDGLMNALKKMFEKLGTRQQAMKIRKIERDPFTVDEKKAFIREKIKNESEFTFEDLFDEYFTRGEIVTTFSALLDLVKNQEVSIEQNGIFETITIRRRVEEDGNRAD